MDPVLIVTLSAELGLCIFTIKMHFIALFNTYLIMCLKISDCFRIKMFHP